MAYRRFCVVVLASLLFIGAATAVAMPNMKPAKEKFAVTAITPGYGFDGTTSRLTITGVGFRHGAQVELVRRSTTGQIQHFETTGEKVSRGGKRITCSFGNAALSFYGLDYWDIRVINPDGRDAWLSSGYITYAAMWPQRISPTSGVAGTTSQLTLYAEGIRPGSQVDMVRVGVDGQEEYFPVDDEYANYYAITFSFENVVAGASGTDLWSVRITDPFGRVAWLRDCYTTTEAP